MIVTGPAPASAFDGLYDLERACRLHFRARRRILAAWCRRAGAGQ